MSGTMMDSFQKQRKKIAYVSLRLPLQPISTNCYRPNTWHLQKWLFPAPWASSAVGIKLTRSAFFSPISNYNNPQNFKMYLRSSHVDCETPQNAYHVQRRSAFALKL
jgi:hypothetical protein